MRAVGTTPILFCSHVVDWGGAETVLADLLAGLDRTQFAPHLACPATGPLVDRAQQLGVPVHPLAIGGRSAWQKLRSLPGAARQLRQLSLRLGARVLYANTMIAGYAGVLAQRPDLPCLWHLHIVTRSRFARWALRRAAAVVTPSRAGAAAVDPAMATSPRLRVVPNGVAAPFFAAPGTGLRQELGLPAETPLVGIVGRLDPHKGHDVLLRAFAGLPGAAHLVVVGGEAFADSIARVRGYGDRLRRLAAELGLQARVHFLGHREDVAAVVHQLDVVAVPSIALESAPRSIAEAQAAGRAVVASRIGGIPELIEHGRTGLLCEPGDVPQLAAALGKLLGEPSLRIRLGRHASEHAVSTYREEEFAAAIGRILAQLAGAPGVTRR